jgi:hypothetical protein
MTRRLAFAAGLAFSAAGASAWMYYVGDGTFSPDGTKVAYYSNAGGVCVINADGTGKYGLDLGRRGISGAPHFVAGGSEFVICGRERHNPNVYVVNVDGTNVRPLTDYPMGDPTSGSPAAYGRVKTGFVSEWDRGRFIYYVDRFPDWDAVRAQRDDVEPPVDEPLSRDYYAGNLDGTAAEVLVENAVPGVAASFSPDGGEVVYAAVKDNALTIYAGETEGVKKPIAEFGPRILEYVDVSWDARKVLCRVGGEPGTELQVMNLDGSARARVVVPVKTDASYFLCAGRVLFFADDGGASYVAAADGSNLKKIADEAVGAVRSPDGTKAAFDYKDDIYAISAEGLAVTNLTADWKAESYGPLFSPAGDKIAFLWYTGDRYSLYVVNSDGSAKKKIVGASWMLRPELWAPTAEKILVSGDFYTDEANDYADVDLATVKTVPPSWPPSARDEQRGLRRIRSGRPQPP